MQTNIKNNFKKKANIKGFRFLVWWRNLFITCKRKGEFWIGIIV